MNLTAEQKAVGIENFYAAIGSSLTQREFLEEANTKRVASRAGLGQHYFGYGGPPESPVRVGVIGTGDEGSVLIGALNPAFVEVRSIADIRPYNQHRAFYGDFYSDTAMEVRPGLAKVYKSDDVEALKKKIKQYGRYEELLDKAKEDDLEAVIIALPLHLHAPAAIAAMQRGLHVLTEKLMGHSVRECKEMARVAQQTGLHLATGHQRHYNILYSSAVKLIEKDVLGDLHYIRAQWHRGNLPGSDSWQQPMPRKAKPSDPQAEKLAKELKSWRDKLDDLRKAKTPRLDEIALWAAKVAQKQAQIADEVLAAGGETPASGFGYTDITLQAADGKQYHRPAIEELIRWRLWDRTGGGLMAELGSHQLDAASIFISAMFEGRKQHPLSVAAASNRPIFPVDRDIDDHVFCLFEFATPDYDPKDPRDKARKKIGVQYASINGNGHGGYGETVLGTRGTLLIEREQEAMLYNTSKVDQKIVIDNPLDKATKQRYLTPKPLEDGDPIDSASTGIGQRAMAEAGRGYAEEIEHWAWCIRNPAPANRPKCHPEVALGDAVIALTTNIAARDGSRIEFDEEWFKIDSDKTPENPKDDPKLRPDVSRYDT